MNAKISEHRRREPEPRLSEEVCTYVDIIDCYSGPLPLSFSEPNSQSFVSEINEYRVGYEIFYFYKFL